MPQNIKFEYTPPPKLFPVLALVKELPKHDPPPKKKIPFSSNPHTPSAQVKK